ncbi:MAG: tetraacyldisaccharide 4'-kinase [Ignavibacteriales bacterium]|nr:tetraacyldisaccharide 4'-kinase [Ignavibacteriales bacterium]
MRTLLLPFSLLYGAGVMLRNWFFDIGIFKTHKVGVPVISVGNISAGGVGKTPFVELLAKRFSQQGRKVAIVSRGYKRGGSGTVVVSNGAQQCAEADKSGDEPAQLAAKLKGVVVIVDEDRVRGARYAVKTFKAQIILLDDGFQHRYVHRDVDIVIVSLEEIFTGDWLLPAGNRREPVSSLRRANLVVISRCGNNEQFQRAKLLLDQHIDKPVAGVMTQASAFRRAKSNFSLDLNGVQGKKIVAFSGIGNPAQFEQTIVSLKMEMKKHLVFADHHRYTEENLKKIEQVFASSNADYLVTTEKDIARLGGIGPIVQGFFDRTPTYYIEIEQKIIAGEKLLNKILGTISEAIS